MVVITFLLCASTRVTVPSPWFRVQTEPPPTARNLGLGPTGTVASTAPDDASTAVTILAMPLVIHIVPSPGVVQSNTGLKEPGAMETLWRTLFDTGSIRMSVPALS